MATKEFNARIRLKRDTSSSWTASDPVLLNGERVVVDTSSGEVRYKTGDGVKKYSQLPFDDEAIRSLITETDNKVTEVETQLSQKITIQRW